MQLYQILEEQLKKEPNFVTDEGQLKKWVVLNKAQTSDPELIGLLLDNNELKSRFFIEIKGVLVFNQSLFSQFLEQKNYLNDSYTQYKNKIGLSVGGKYLHQRNEVSLVWPFKDCVLEGGQSREEDKREEIFFNEVLAQDEITQLFEPKVLTNFRRYNEEQIKKNSYETEPVFKRRTDGTISDNLIIKGNNLLALHSLKKEFAGKVKLIYIDPPFNTENDSFNYNDKFNHSTWLTFMKNRLYIAKDFLSEDGSIFVHIDYNETHYIKILMDEVFGRENFKNNIVWCYTGPAGAHNFLPRKHDDILWYGKGEFSKFKMPYIPHKSGVHNTGQVFGSAESKESFKEETEAKGKKLEDWWIDIYSTDRYRSEKIQFSGQKPEKLIQRIVDMITNQGDLILDYHLGSGTSAVVAHKMGRQYIGIEQMDYIETIAVDRLKKVIEGEQSGISKAVDWSGGGDFVYLELKKHNQEFIDRIEEAKTTDNLLKIWSGMKQRSFLNYNVDIKKQDEHIEEFKQLTLDEQKRHMVEILDKNQIYVNLSSLDDQGFACSDDEKKLTKGFYEI